jgi:hypothetical protein
VAEHSSSDVEHEPPESAPVGEYVPACPIDGCDVTFLGATEDDVVDHVLSDHEDLVHPHWNEGEITASHALSRLVQEAQGPRHVERPSAELPDALVTFLDAYLVYLFLGLLLLLIGWPFIVKLAVG